ncbi:MAG: formylglycine-generating enzyme family protein [Bacteroidales bacterium]|jgi:formylglycine-generating enzyme required for sulfatase activity|nr:formylglycine-generating enzyme family protein [Bacteroidales bacterium]
MNRASKLAVVAMAAVMIFGGCKKDKDETPSLSINPSMVAVAGGTTTLNGTSVTINSFQIGKYEVTQKQWWDVMGSWPGTAPSDTYGKGDNYPMYFVSWDDIQSFLAALNLLTGKSYRLPTEAEWEYAAKGGQSTHNYTYSGSNTLADVAWYSDNSEVKTHPAGTQAPNELGIYDMTGNVCEWCSDWYGSAYPSGADNPTGAISGSDRVYRGGSWDNNAGSCHVSYRDYYTPAFRFSFIGFRLVLSL